MFSWFSLSTVLVASFARLLDLSGSQAPTAVDPAAAMRADWTRAGDDLRAAMRATEPTLPADAVAEVGELVETK